VIRDSTIRFGAAGVTIGSETSGGFRNIEAYGLTILAPVPIGILFKSTHTRGGFAENIRIHDLTMVDVPTVFQVNTNWNPSYSNATIPATEKNYPDSWRILSTPLPAKQGIPHFHDVHIWNIRATGAKTAFEVAVFPQVPLERFTLDHLNIQAATAGKIQNARDWKFSDIVLKTADGSSVAVSDSTNITVLKPN
jgi:polygalacturonase